MLGFCSLPGTGISPATLGPSSKLVGISFRSTEKEIEPIVLDFAVFSFAFSLLICSLKVFKFELYQKFLLAFNFSFKIFQYDFTSQKIQFDSKSNFVEEKLKIQMCQTFSPLPSQKYKFDYVWGNYREIYQIYISRQFWRSG